MSIEEILAHLKEDDANSMQGENVVAHSVQGEDDDAHSVHGEDAADFPEASDSQESDSEDDDAHSVQVKRRGPKRGTHGRRKQFIWGSRANGSNVAARQIRGQAVLHNRSGRAKTKDELIMLAGSTPRAVRRGTEASRRIGPKFRSRKIGKKGGAWKMWTPECILSTVYEVTKGSMRPATPQHASHSTSLQCLQTVAAAVMAAQEKALSKRKRLLEHHALAEASHAFYITNTMFDETQLWVRMLRGGRRLSRKKRRRVLAASGQVTWGDVGGPSEDAGFFPPTSSAARLHSCMLCECLSEGR